MPTLDLRPVFVVSTGRSGSQMVARVLGAHPSVLALHEPMPHLLTEAYLKWRGARPPEFFRYRLRRKRERNVSQYVDNGLCYVESSHYMSHFIPELRELFDARFVFLYRDGRTFTRSALDKGWYEEVPALERAKTLLRRRLPIDVGNPWHDHWLEPPAGLESRFEKCAWLWSEINGLILRDLGAVPERDQLHLPLEGFGPESIGTLLGFLGADGTNGLQERMEEIASARPNKSKQKTHAPPSEWEDARERRFMEIAGDVYRRLGYTPEPLVAA